MENSEKYSLYPQWSEGECFYRNMLRAIRPGPKPQPSFSLQRAAAKFQSESSGFPFTGQQQTYVEYESGAGKSSKN